MSHYMHVWKLFTSVERASFEVQRFPSRFANAFLSGAECPEVLSSLGGDIGKQLQNYAASYGQKTIQGES